jgi:predicted RNA polymerase sigma factor
VQGPRAALELLKPLDDELGGHYRLDAVRGHLYEMLGEPGPAAEHLVAAARRTTSLRERDYLTIKAAELSDAERRRQ